ncbi:MAG: hypothetical protein U9R53_00870 [Chloroflexota bacterium]|nr:hypothetical protein [Chloroflexota bacterium]
MSDQVNRNSFSKLWVRARQWLKNLFKEPVFYIYLLAVLIYLPWFLPNLSDISPWDETYYIVSGRDMLSGQLPVLGYSPLLSFLAMLCNQFFRNSEFWLIHTNSVMRFILFSFLFVGNWHVGVALKGQFKPIILFGFLFISPVLTLNFEYPSDLLFAAIAAMAFAQAIHFINTKQIKHVWWASFWLGLGMLTRGDAMILIAVLAVFVVWMGAKHHRWWRLLLAVLIPFLALSFGYVVFRGVVTGDFNTGMGERSYTAFEQGQEVDMPESDARFDAPIESYFVARELFGTPEENDYSVFRAISRNPKAYLSRLREVLKTLPGLFLTAYYRRYAIFLALLAVRGLIALIQQKKIPLAILHIVWIIPLSAGIARTLVRVGYFRLFHFVIYSLAIIGLKALLNSLKKSWEKWAWIGVLSVVLVAAFIRGDEAIRMGMAVFLAWLILAILLAKRSKPYPNWQPMAMILLLASAFLLRMSMPIYEPRVLGQDPQEQASLILREVTEPGDIVLTCTPSVVFLADREVANFCSADIPKFDTSEAFEEWFQAQDFKAIYLDHTSPDVLVNLSFDQRGKLLTWIFSSKGGEASIFILNEGN